MMDLSKISLIATIAGITLLVVSAMIPLKGHWSEDDADALNLARAELGEQMGFHAPPPGSPEAVEPDPARTAAAKAKVELLSAKLEKTRTANAWIKALLRYAGVLAFVGAVACYIVARVRGDE